MHLLRLSLILLRNSNAFELLLLEFILPLLIQPQIIAHRIQAGNGTEVPLKGEKIAPRYIGCEKGGYFGA
jgi:hypothetical protein